MFKSPSGGIQLKWDDNGRTYIDHVTPPSGTISDAVPVWLRLVRDGSSYTGYYSTEASCHSHLLARSAPGENGSVAR